MVFIATYNKNNTNWHRCEALFWRSD